MVDLHSHVMFGWDDGAETLDVSMEMARIAAEDGTRTLAATPHLYWKGERVDPEMVRERVAVINAAIEKEGLSLRVITGTEIPAMWDNLTLIERGQALKLGDSRTVLFEVPFQQHPVRFKDLIFQLRMEGVTPLMAHPERSGPFLDDIDLFHAVIEEDVPVQINTSSLTGLFGERVQDLAWEIVAEERPVVISSDAHGTGKRRPMLSDARALLEEAFGEEAADLMCRGNAAALLENRPPRIARIPRKAEDAERRTGLAGRLKRAFGRS